MQKRGLPSLLLSAELGESTRTNHPQLQSSGSHCRMNLDTSSANITSIGSGRISRNQRISLRKKLEEEADPTLGGSGRIPRSQWNSLGNKLNEGERLEILRLPQDGGTTTSSKTAFKRSSTTDSGRMKRMGALTETALRNLNEDESRDPEQQTPTVRRSITSQSGDGTACFKRNSTNDSGRMSLFKRMGSLSMAHSLKNENTTSSGRKSMSALKRVGSFTKALSFKNLSVNVDGTTKKSSRHSSKSPFKRGSKIMSGLPDYSKAKAKVTKDPDLLGSTGHVPKASLTENFDEGGGEAAAQSHARTKGPKTKRRTKHRNRGTNAGSTSISFKIRRGAFGFHTQPSRQLYLPTRRL